MSDQDDSRIIKEILEDGSEYIINLDICDAACEEALDFMDEKFDGLEGYDQGAALFSLFISCLYGLETYGWTQKQLMQEIVDHMDGEEIFKSSDI